MNDFERETVIIKMSVGDDSAMLSPYCETGKPVISSEVAEFLENSANGYHPKEKLSLEIASDCIDDTEKERYRQAIRNYFSLKYQDVKRGMRRKTVISIWFTIIGVLALALMFVLDGLKLNSLWIECIDIFAWVFLWEAVDQFFIERGGLLLRQKRLLNFINMDVKYTDGGKQ